jgi:hypothetical protein
VAGGAAALDATTVLLFHDRWWDTPRRDFRLIWGRSPSRGQDALLHGFVAYHTAQLGSISLRWACLSPPASAWVGAAGAVLLQLPKEIGDGFYNGFSGTDMLWVSAGAALAAARQTWRAAAAVSLKAWYWPSREYRTADAGSLSALTDYAGQRYSLAVHPGALSSEGPWPGWLGLAVAHGIQAWLSEPPRRQWYLTLDARLGGLPIRPHWWRSVASVLDQIHFPLPGIRVDREGVRVGFY